SASSSTRVPLSRAMATTSARHSTVSPACPAPSAASVSRRRRASPSPATRSTPPSARRRERQDCLQDDGRRPLHPPRRRGPRAASCACLGGGGGAPPVGDRRGTLGVLEAGEAEISDLCAVRERIADECEGRLGHEDLPAVAGGEQAGDAVERRAEVVVVAVL